MAQLNLYKVKEWAALLIVGCLSTMSFAVGVMFYNFWIAIICFLVALFISVLVASMILRNDFTDMLKGRGIMFIDLTSTGVLKTFIMQVLNPFVTGKSWTGKKTTTIFDREAVHQLAVPEKIKAGFCRQEVSKDGKKYVVFVFDEETFNKGRYQLLQYPTMIWNSQIDAPLTKDMLSEMEKTTFAEHQILYLNRQIEKLCDYMLNFGRYVVDLLKPKGGLLGQWWIWVIIIIFVVIMIAMFGPVIAPVVKNSMAAASGAVGT